MGVPRASVTVVPAGVDTGRFSPEGPVADRGSRPRLLTVAPVSNNLVLSYIGQHVLGMPRSY